VGSSGLGYGLITIGLLLSYCAVFPQPFHLLRKSWPVTLNLFHIVNDAKQIPLGIYLGFTTHGETIQTECEADIREYRFQCSHPLATYNVKNVPYIPL
jgi:hypothetical protein